MIAVEEMQYQNNWLLSEDDLALFFRLQSQTFIHDCSLCRFIDVFERFYCEAESVEYSVTTFGKQKALCNYKFQKSFNTPFNVCYNSVYE